VEKARAYVHVQIRGRVDYERKNMDEVRARRLILQALYKERKREPQGAIERSQLAQRLALTPQDAQFNVGYLAEKGLVRISKPTVDRRKFFFVHITAEGIDLIEDPNEFNNRFPPQVIVQNVLGDKLDIVIGDHASNVSVGKGILHVVQLGASTRTLTDICSKFIQEFDTALTLNPEQIALIADQVYSLADILAQEDPDLGEIQRIKRFLAKQEGRPAVRTSVLFSHDVVAQPIRRAVKRLIGYAEGGIDDE
jgi:DNA-binding MarR family transcriptional regulator